MTYNWSFKIWNQIEMSYKTKITLIIGSRLYSLITETVIEALFNLYWNDCIMKISKLNFCIKIKIQTEYIECVFFNHIYCLKFSGSLKFSLRDAAPGDIVHTFQKKMSSRNRQVSRVTPLPLRELAEPNTTPIWSQVTLDTLGHEQDVVCLKVTNKGVIIREDDFLLLSELFHEHWDDLISPAIKSRKVAGDLIAFAIRAIWPGQSFTSICQPYGYEQRSFSEFNSHRESAFLGKYSLSIQINLLLWTVRKVYRGASWNVFWL